MAFGGFGGGGNKPLFGQQSAPAFGVSAFGATSGTGLFGSSTPATGPAGAFGATAPPAQGSGLFGAAQQQQQQQQQQPSGFGATSGFGAGAQSSGFGAGAQGFGGFGAQSSSAFGGGGGFGAQSGSGFGGFGAQSSSAFGGGGGGGSGFGAQSGSGFGGFGGGFGAQQQQQQTPPGTRAVKYQITSDITSGAGSEGKYIAITAMPAYAAKSIEELRIEDYLKNDRGGPNPAAAGTGLFGSAPPAASPFAQQPQSTPALFGAPAKPSLFAQAQSAAGLFGTAASGSAPLFGQSAPAQSGAGLFGAAPQSAPSIFGGGATGGAATFGSGATAAPAGFGAAPQTGLFGQSGGALFGGGGAAISGPGLFGASAPGATTQATGSSIFGPKPSTGTSLFGAPASGGALFGGGSGGGSGGGLFGSSGSAFGAKPPGALFGSSGQTSGGLFGTTPQSSGGLFGTTPQASGGLFGSTPQSSGGLFGPSGGGLFGGGFRANSGSAFGGGGFGGSGAFGMPSGFGAFGTQQAAPAPLQASVNIDPFGSSQLYAHAEQALRQAGITADGVKTEEGAAAKPTVVVGQVRAGPYSRARATAARGPGAFESARRALGADLFRTAPNANGATFRMGSTTRPQARFADSGRPRHSLAPWRTPKQALRAATIKKLVIEPLPTTSDVSSLDGRASSIANGRHVPTAAARGTVRFEKGDAIMPPEPAHESADEEEVTVADVENSTVEVLDLRRDPSVPKPTPRYLVGQARADDGTPQVYSKYSEFYKANVASPRRRRSIERSRRREAEEREAEEASPPFTKRLDIETRPSLDELAQMSPEELRCVKDFAVVRQGIGQVQWYGETDVTGLDIDRVVDLRFREIRVYPLEEECPPVGTGLNKRAVVKLHGIWKKDRASRMPMKDSRAAENMIVKLKLHCEKEGLRFIGYEVGSGTWTFEAQRF